MNFHTFVVLIRLYWKTFVAVATSVFVASAVWIMLTHNQYVSNVQLMVAVNGSTTAEAYENDTLITGRINSYIALLGTDAISQRVIDKLGLKMSAPELVARISATNVPPKTAIIDVAVNDDSAEQARRIATAIGDEFVSYTAALETPTGEGAQKVVTSVVSPASAPHRRWLEKVFLGLLAAVFAAIAGGIGVWVRSATDPIIRTAYRAAIAAKAPVLGYVSAEDGQPVDELNGYRRLRNRLRLPFESHDPIVLEIAPVDPATELAVPATRVSGGFAQVMAIAGKRPIVVNASGTNALVPPVRDVAVTDWVVGPYEATTNAGYRFVAGLCKDYDAIVIAVPPVLSSLTASAVSDYADAVVLLVMLGRTRRSDVAKAAESLNLGGVSKICVILVDQEA